MAADERVSSDFSRSLLESTIRALPKIELHAHINGSVSESTARKLVELKKKKVQSWKSGQNGVSSEQILSQKEEMQRLEKWDIDCSIIRKGEHRSLAQCFAIFKLVHELGDTEEAAYIVTRDVIHEFASDNIKYLELRTTPRAVPETGMTRRSYVEAVLRAIRDCHQEDPHNIVVRLLLAIDRGRHSVQDAQEVVDLAHDLRQSSMGIVVGVDLSGDPSKGDARMYLPMFQDAKRRGLKTALHLAEVKGCNEETLVMLDLPPDRVGHGTFLHPEQGGSEQIIAAMDKHKIPLELCLTSNVCIQTVDTYSNHQMRYWLSKTHPVIICTDDKGVFDTSLSEEYMAAASTFHLTAETLWQHSFDSISHIFADEDVKHKLRSQWTAWKQENEDCFNER